VEVLDEIPALLNAMGIFPFSETKSSFHLSLDLKALGGAAEFLL